MLFKLSMKNIQKSFKDYAIYFITLVFGVAIFYMFNSLDKQEAMLIVSKSTKQIIELLIDLLSGVSVFVAVVLGLLIVYANNFLINRRKKEFGIYMTLGMGRRQISKIILLETVFVGIISLCIGLVLGIFASQFMSILVAKLFQADMSKFEFIFSTEACMKTCIFFAIMYIAVMIFNTFTISRYKLINLLTATKKNEKVKIKNPFLCILVFLVAAAVLSYCYYKVTIDMNSIIQGELYTIIGMGIVSTVLVFWSMSGFILQVVQLRKKLYLKDTNMFVLRQINNKINTMVISMSVICLMLFVTITILSTALSLRNSMEKDLKEMTPVDLNLYKTANLPERIVTRWGKEVVYSEEAREDSKHSIQDSLTAVGYDMSNLKDVLEFCVYADSNITLESTLGEAIEDAKAKYPMMLYDTAETIVKISDYNKVAKLYGNEEFSLKDNEYIIICNFDNISAIRNKSLEIYTNININGKDYVPKYKECKDGFIEISTSHTNAGIILVPDSCELNEDQIEQWFFVANYNAETEEEKAEIEKDFTDAEEKSLINKLNEQSILIDGESKISLIESSVGLAVIIVFIAIYIGVVFLIASSAILALKQLTESSDNRQRYIILRKIGCDEKMINSALFKQIGIFFMLPLVVAIIHSIFGIQFGVGIMEVIASKEELLPSAIMTVVLISVVYGIYFLATYLGSKNIIKED